MGSETRNGGVFDSVKGKKVKKYRLRGVVIALKSARDKDHNNNSWGFLAYSHQGNHFLTLFF
ncbi:hypothetical protein B7R74_02965 [Yersinia pseudotuberculosis]|nr:hypothetical protein B7R74_02965 [Yersinia pseudotuberculosis]